MATHLTTEQAAVYLGWTTDDLGMIRRALGLGIKTGSSPMGRGRGGPIVWERDLMLRIKFLTRRGLPKMVAARIANMSVMRRGQLVMP